MTSSSGLRRRGVIVKPLTGRHVVAWCGYIRLRGRWLVQACSGEEGSPIRPAPIASRKSRTSC
jgi:hypothetical protein